MSDTKVLHVIARMNVGGTARYVGELVKGIPGSKLATGYVQGQEMEDPILNKIEFIRVENLGRKISPINDLRSWFELRKIIKELKPEIVHTHTFKAGLIGRLIPGKFKRVHTFHGHLFEDSSFSTIAKFFIILIEKFLANRTDVLISVGEKVGQEIRNKGIGKNKKWVSIPPGVKPLPKYEKVEARRKLNLPESGLLVGWMARMAPVKNPFLLLKVARELPDVQFVMAGGGELLDQVKSKAPNNVQIIGWTDASYFWSAVDLAVSTSDNEGMPISLIEAQMAGVPVISTDVGSSSETIRDGTTGFVTIKSMPTLVQKIKELTLDDKKFNSFKENSKIIANSKFGVKIMLLSQSDIYSLRV